MLFQILSSCHVSTSRGPLVRLCGRTDEDRSVIVTIPGQLPFFYVCATDVVTSAGTAAYAQQAATMMMDGLNEALNAMMRRADLHTHSQYAVFDESSAARRTNNATFTHVVSCAWVLKHDFYGYTADKKNYLKLTFASVEAAQRARQVLSKPLGSPKYAAVLPLRTLKKWFSRDERDDAVLRTACQGTTDPLNRGQYQFVLAEANIGFDHQLMEQMKLHPGGWVDVDTTLCHADTIAMSAYHKLVAGTRSGGHIMDCLKPAANVARNAPVRVLAFDLETYCRPVGDAMQFFDGDHPEAKLLCVSADTWSLGSTSIQSTVFALNDVEDRETVKATDDRDVDVRWFTDEKTMIQAFFLFVVSEVDADIITGWNTLDFDWPWLIKRCLFLNISLNCLARFGTVTVDTSDKAWQLIQIPGRIVHDTMVWMKRNRSLREYGLEFCSTEFGLNGKDDVEYNQIHDLFQTREGRIKLAVYCEMDSRLVIQLLKHPALDPLGKTLAISQLTGVSPEDQLFRGSMNTLRLALLRAAHADDFLLSCPLRVDPDPDFVATSSDDDAGEARYQGGKVLHPITGFYRCPVVTLDFSSLYPSVMCELNICSSTRTTREYALEHKLPYTQPPAPALTGVWYNVDGSRAARITEISDSEISIYEFPTRVTIQARYTSELNESISLSNGVVMMLADGGYELRNADGTVWHRLDSDVLVMVDASVREGVIPKLERLLKSDRKAAKRKLADAEAVEDSAAAAYHDNFQNAIKVVMNALYGGLGSGKGGIFPDGAPLASSITARGRFLIVLVKKTVENRFWLLPDGSMGGVDDEEQIRPENAKPPRVLYGDTVRFRVSVVQTIH